MEMASGVKLFSSMMEAMFVAIGRASGHFPILAFVANSHATTALMQISLSSAANRLVDEALRMVEHPGAIFRPGPTGRRAALAGGPDVWEVIRAVKSAHAAEPALDSDDLMSLVSSNTGVELRLLTTAVRYWAAYPDEIDAEIAAADAAEEAAEQAWLRERQLLAG